jgi:hypothetical protein
MPVLINQAITWPISMLGYSLLRTPTTWMIPAVEALVAGTRPGRIPLAQQAMALKKMEMMEALKGLATAIQSLQTMETMSRCVHLLNCNFKDIHGLEHCRPDVI